MAIIHIEIEDEAELAELMRDCIQDGDCFLNISGTVAEELPAAHAQQATRIRLARQIIQQIPETR